MSYDEAALQQLDTFRKAGDRTAYDEKLIALGDPYGAMALGVVKQSNIAGVVARRYAIAVSQRCCRPTDDAMWLKISNALMNADFAARGNDVNFEPGTPSLRWDVIRDYHVAVFGANGCPPESWTAWIPLQIDGEAKDAKLWHRMVTENFLTVSAQTVWLVSGRIAHAQGVQRDMASHVAPQLQYNPPLATDAPPDAKTAACMARTAQRQLSPPDANDKERLALFYLGVLAKDPGLLPGMAVIAPTSAWRSRPALISPAYYGVSGVSRPGNQPTMTRAPDAPRVVAMHTSLPDILLAIAALLVLVSAVQPLARRLAVSDAVLLAPVGVLIGAGSAFLLRTELTDAFNGAALTLLQFPVTAQAFLLIFLPVLVFDGALRIDVRRLARDAAPVLLMAVVAVLLTTAAVGVALLPLAGLPLAACLLLGAIVATTDPSAVVGVFREIGANSRLTRLVEGEALLNDAAAISVVALLLAELTSGAAVSLPHAALQLLLSFAGGLGVGFVLARLVLAAVPLLGGVRAAEVTLSLALPYLAAIGCEEFLHVSGVVAVAAAGLTLSAVGPSTFRPQSWAQLHDFWGQVSFLASSLVFVLASMLVPRLLLGLDRHDLVLLGAALLAATAARAAVLWGLLPLLTRFTLAQQVPDRFKVTMLWGGLRGAITLALALSVTENAAVPPPVQRFVAITATGFALFTLLVNGTTLRFVVRALRLDRLSPIDQALRSQVLAIGLNDVRDRVAGVAAEFGFSPAAAAHVRALYDRRSQAEEADNTFHTAIGDRDRVRLGLISYASQERSVLLDAFRDQAAPRRIVGALLRAADGMVDGARTDGRLGYLRAARRPLRPTLRFRAAQWLHRRGRIHAPLVRTMTERYEMLFIMRLVAVAMAGFMRRRMQPVLGARVAEVVGDIAGRREGLLDDAMEAMRLQYPGYAEALENRTLRQIALRLEGEEYAHLRADALIGEELHGELVRALDAQRRRAARPLRFDLQAGLGARIRDIPVFAALPEAVRHDLSMRLTMRFAVPGERICRVGERARSVFFVSSGALRAQDSVGQGGHELLLERGSFFGEDDVLRGGRRRRRVTSARFSHLLELRDADLRELMEEVPDFARHLAEAAERRDRGEDEPGTDAAAAQPRLLGLDLTPTPGE